MPIYNINDNKLTQIKKVNFKNERELQRLTENNLEELFNLKFIESEFQVDNLRIDTLAYSEETNSFVIIEYKNTKNFSVIDQGYSYLALLLNNKAEFVLKYNQVLNENAGKEDFDFSQTRVMFIAPSYTTYQLKSVEFSDIPFELWKVSKFSNNTVLFNQINNSQAVASISQISTGDKKQSITKEIKKYSEEDLFENKDSIELYTTLKERILTEFEDIEIVITKLYAVFKVNKKIIASVTPLSKSLKMHVNAKRLDDYKNLCKDVSNIGHWGVGDYELKLQSEKDFDYFLELFSQSYEEKL
ncbi:DUF5655 domain-containing protein [Methanobrevibacter sp.]|uniref:DUF5655 domain-containing protein n=1 Tax=Methanobrevibacter sp. TaxID=66852 RepID=UPI003864F401